MEKSVSNGDYSFDAKHDGKFMYCFGNEHWGASSKEVSFNVHGIVYVSESDSPSDPLEAEGMYTHSRKTTSHGSRTFANKNPPSSFAASGLQPPPRCPAHESSAWALTRADNMGTVKKLSELLAQVKDEQSYIVVRERTHRNTAESTNSRVKWWNVFIIGVVIGESVFQVWWLRRFFEVKRVV